MDLRDYLSPINPLSCLSHPIHLRCIGSLSSYTPLPLLSLLIPLLSSPLSPPEIIDLGWVYFALFTFYTHFTYIPSIPPYTVRVKNSSHPISIGGYLYYTSLYYPLFLYSLLLYLLFNLISLLYLLYYYIFLLPVGCSTPYGVCLHLIYPIYLLYCIPTFTFFLYHIFTILSYSLYLSSFTRRVLQHHGVGLTSYSLSLYPLIVYLILSILYQIYPSFLYGTHSFLITRRVFHTLRGFYTSSLLISISSISYSLFSLCTIPYLSVLPLLHTFLIFILYCLHILHTSSTTRRVTPYGLSTLSIRDVSFLSHLFIYTSFIHIFTLFTYLYILLLTHILIFIIFLLIIYIIIL